MPVFRLETRTQEGELRRQVVVAQTRDVAVRQMRARGVYVVNVRKVRIPRTRKPGPWLASVFRPVSPREKAVFFLQLHELLSAGIHPVEALEELKTTTRAPSLRRFCDEGARRVAEGLSLAELFASYPEIFEPWVVGAVSAAERSGEFEALIQPLEEEYRAGERERKRLVYPVTYGKAIAAFSLIAATIPVAITHGLAFWITNTILNGGPLVLMAIAAWYALRFVGALPPVRSVSERLALRLPVVGPGRRTAYSLRFLRAYAAMVKAGALPQEAFEVAAAAVGPAWLERRAQRGVEHLRRGGTLSEALHYAGVLDPRTQGLMETAEDTGEFDSILAECLNTLQSDADRESMRRTIWMWAILLLVSAV